MYVSITVNLPDNVEIDLPAKEVEYYAGLLRPIANAMDTYTSWTSLVVTITRGGAKPTAIATFVD